MVKFKLSKQTLTALWGNFLERCRFCNELISHSHQSHLQPHFVNTCKLRYSLLALNQVHSSSKHCDLLLQIKNPGYSRYFHSLIFNRILHLIYPTLLALGCKLGCEGVVKLFYAVFALFRMGFNCMKFLPTFLLIHHRQTGMLLIIYIWNTLIWIA